MGSVIKLFMICIGILLFIFNLFSLAKRKMAPMFSVVWSVFALLMIVVGIAVKLTVLENYMSWQMVFLLIFAATIAIVSIYMISIQISELIAQNHELTMQVSLLNEENRRFRNKYHTMKLEEDNE